MKTIQHKFVEFIPEVLEDDTLYITIKYKTAAHICICGCGNKVITPFSPADWQLIFNGKTVSLKPSIGNWSFDCQSHYWITNNEIIYAEKWSEEKIKKNRKADKRKKKKFFLKWLKGG